MNQVLIIVVGKSSDYQVDAFDQLDRAETIKSYTFEGYFLLRLHQSTWVMLMVEEFEILSFSVFETNTTS